MDQYIEICEVLGLTYEVKDNFCLLVSRDSMINRYPNLDEESAYQKVKFDFLHLDASPFLWMKSDDNWFLLKKKNNED